MQDNLDTKIVDGELHYSDAVEERISLSDRFGLWLSFYQPNMQDYLKIIDYYFRYFKGDRETMYAAAKEFSMTRASKSGRTPKQFYNFYSLSEDLFNIDSSQTSL